MPPREVLRRSTSSRVVVVATCRGEDLVGERAGKHPGPVSEETYRGCAGTVGHRSRRSDTA